MGSPQRFLNGIASVASDNPVGALPYLDPTKWCIWFEDFVQFPDTAASSAWTDTNTNGTLAVASTLGCGIATQTLGGADNDLSQVYLATATLQIATAKKFIFEAKVKVDKGAAGTIGEQEVFVGLSAVLTGANFTAADGLTMTTDDCVGFWSPDGSASWSCIVRDTDVESIDTAAATMVDATWYVLSWYYDGIGTVKFYVNDVLVASLTDIPEDTALTPTIFIKGGEAKPAVLSTDYLLVARER